MAKAQNGKPAQKVSVTNAVWKMCEGCFGSGKGLNVCSNCQSWSEEYKRKVPCHVCKDTRSVATRKCFACNGAGKVLYKESQQDKEARIQKEKEERSEQEEKSFYNRSDAAERMKVVNSIERDLYDWIKMSQEARNTEVEPLLKRMVDPVKLIVFFFKRDIDIKLEYEVLGPVLKITNPAGSKTESVYFVGGLQRKGSLLILPVMRPDANGTSGITYIKVDSSMNVISD